MIVTIDGPAGAGKSSVAQALARRLGFRFLDTGAMYRAVTLAAIRRGVDLADRDAVLRLAEGLSIELADGRVLLDGRDVSDEIRAVEVTRLSQHVANHGEVRSLLVGLQRQTATVGDTVTEGRDQGTVAFPHAECKIFLTASPAERARRRQRDLHAAGQQVTFEQVLADQQERDQRDRNRPVGPLVQADDAIEVVTDGLTEEEVVDLLETLVDRS
jgi:cytidylate kinase